MSITTNYSVARLKAEAYNSIDRGIIDFQQPIYVLWAFVPSSKWSDVEWELSKKGYSLEDRICDFSINN